MMSKRILLLLLIGFLVSLPALLPLLRPTFFHMHDYTHVARLAELDRALADGHFPVRWSQNLGFGYGLPQFSFYAPLPYYMAWIFYGLGMPAIWAIKTLVALLFVGAFVCMYLASARYWGSRWGGFLSAVIFVYAPYRAVDFYVRGAIGELAAITALAGILAALTAVDVSAKKQIFWLAVATFALICSHNLTAFIGLPILFVLGIVLTYVEGRFDSRQLVTQIFGYLLGVGAAAFYWMPALFEKDYTMVDTLTQGFSDFRQHFLYLRQFFISEWGYGGSVFGLEDDVSFNIGAMMVVLAVVASGSQLYVAFKKKQLTTRLIQTALLGVLIIVSMLMATFKTQFLWEAIPLLSFVQFPWRFLTVIIVLVSFMAGGALWLVPKRLNNVAGVGLAVVVITVNVGYFKPQGYLENSSDLYYTDVGRIQTEMSGVIPDFMPTHQRKLPIEPPSARFEVVSSEGATMPISAQVDAVDEFVVQLNADEVNTFIAHILYFPGWNVYLDGEHVGLNLDPEWPVLELDLSGVSDEVVVSGVFEETAVRQAANLISIISFAAMILVLRHTKHLAKT